MPDQEKAPPAISKLSARHKAIVKAYTTPGQSFASPTYAGLAVNPDRSKVAARQEVWRALKIPDVRAAVDDAMAQFNATHAWRVKTLREAADSNTVLTEEKETIGPDGEVTKTVVRHSPRPADVARIVDVLNKMDGTYNQQAAAAQVTQRYASLAHRFHTQFANTTQNNVEYVAMEQSVPPTPKRGTKCSKGRKGVTRMIGCIPVIYRRMRDYGKVSA